MCICWIGITRWKIVKELLRRWGDVIGVFGTKTILVGGVVRTVWSVERGFEMGGVDWHVVNEKTVAVLTVCLVFGTFVELLLLGLGLGECGLIGV